MYRALVLKRVNMYEDVIRDAESGYWEALKSLVKAARLSLDDVVAMNARYEIIYSKYSRRGRREVGENLPAGCTSAAVLTSSTTEGHLLMDQNWDWIPGIRCVLRRFRPAQGPEVLAFTEAGTVGDKIGLNSAASS